MKQVYHKGFYISAYPRKGLTRISIHNPSTKKDTIFDVNCEVEEIGFAKQLVDEMIEGSIGKR